MADQTQIGTNANAGPAEGQEKSQGGFKENLGTKVVTWGLLAVAVVGVVALIVVLNGPSEQMLQGVKDILAILLPVIAAWVGTVLAFYFGRENFATASDKAAMLFSRATPEQKLQSIGVRTVMIPIEKADKFPLTKEDKDVLIKTDILNGHFVACKNNRVPFVDGKGCVKYLLHRSMFDRFVAESAMADPPKDLAKLTLADMVSVDPYRGFANSFVPIGPDANLRDAKAAIDSYAECSDVVVTEDGSKSGKALGFITNVIVSEKSKL
jgi:hypothetical protein